MIVHVPTQKILLNLSNPKKVTSVIPTARQFTFRGVPLVAVPHRLDEVRVLRNLGFEAPAPTVHHPPSRSSA
jgi:hypothetical protein